MEKADPNVDVLLMRRLADGELAALGQLVRRHQDRVRALAYRLTGRSDAADDLAQEAFLRLHRSAGSYEPTAAFTTFLYRIVVNLCLDWRKKPRMALLREDAAARDQASSAGDEALRRERAQAIRSEVDALPDRQRTVLVLHRFESLSHAQIAQATGWSESAVESLLVRAYSALRQRLAAWREA